MIDHVERHDCRIESSSAAAMTTIDVFWIPLGAGQHVVRASGRAFEALSAFIQRRHRYDLFHSALAVHVPEGRYVIEMTPVEDRCGDQRGVVIEGAVGSRLLRRFRVFRYEVRRWLNGTIPDESDATSSVHLQVEVSVARRLLDAAPFLPSAVWGRDELHAGEMWNSNSITSWLLSRSGVDIATITPPHGGRAPGWDAGIAVAGRISLSPEGFAAASGPQPLRTPRSRRSRPASGDRSRT